MAGASFILAINLVIAALFALAFLLVALTNRSDRVALWFALAYVFGIAYVFCEFVLPTQSYAKIAYVVGFMAFLGAVTAVSIGITRRYNRPVPWLLIGVAVAGFGVTNWLAFDLERDSMMRMMGYQAPYAFMQALAAWVVLRSRRRQPIDLALMALFSLSALQFLSKPLVANLTGGTGGTAQEYLVTTYALYSQSLGAVLQVATGLVMLMLLVRDMLVDITAKSETDALSGLYNRRGFEERAIPLLAAARSDKVPVSIVIADLDAFKAINDTFGHDRGDEVIVAFARLIRDQAPKRAIVSRIGGEEFAVVLPSANAAMARLYAETVRSGFAGLAIAGLPGDFRCTASFGVAESDGEDSLSDLRRRADAALYAAKRGGRDRVCVAGEATPDVMPAHPLAGTLAMGSR
ncbi:diguanylate cyclase [Devosia sp.]|uniref:GGDEF domain-containing protein n=1 Tax=Devosia sp. TaxID=1871048 RepID=UPI003BAAED20